MLMTSRELADAAVERELALALARQTIRGRVLSAIAIPVVIAVLIGEFSRGAIAGWGMVVVADALADWFIARPQAKALVAGDVDSVWLRRATGHFASFGLAWGSLPIFALLGGTTNAQWLTTIMIVAMVTVFIVTTAASRKMFAVGVLGLMGLMSVTVMVSNAMPGLLAILSLVYVGIALSVHDALHRSLVESVRSRHEAERLNERLNEFVAERDPATQLLNRRSFIAKLETLLVGAPSRAITVNVGSVRRMTAINELYGEQFGDALIASVGERLLQIPATTGFASRLSGDEFAIASFVDDSAVTVRNIASGAFSSSGISATIDFSSSSIRSGRLRANAEELVADAIFSLRAERSGRSPERQIRSSESAHARRELVEELRNGLHDAGVTAWFQPIVDAATRDVVAWEALVRWNHPGIGMVPPDRLFPLLEMSGMASHLAELMITESLAFLGRLDKQGVTAHSVHVNVNATDLRDHSMCDAVFGALQDNRIAAERLVLELTEREILHVDQTIRATLSRLDLAGVHLAVDDFGTGFSSLSHLLDFPADHLKIDQRFISGLPDDVDAHTLVRGIVSMASGLGLTTVAEGVETEAAALSVHQLGCDQIQGFLVSPALAPAKAIAWLATYEPTRTVVPPSRHPSERASLAI
jgi:predicted signal transduction protein with EAL and GGDEF domain